MARRIEIKNGLTAFLTFLTGPCREFAADTSRIEQPRARLLQRVPEIAEKIEGGTLNLAQISKLQRTVRLAKKEGRKVEVADQRAILEKLEKRSGEQTDLILANEFALPVQVEERTHIQRDESVRVEITFSKEEMALIKHARDILSHQTGGGLKETVLEMARKIAAERGNSKADQKGLSPRTSSAATVAAKMTAPALIATARTTIPALRTVTPRLRKEILSRDRCCQYRDKFTGRMCGSTSFLEVDHIQPRFAGGKPSGIVQKSQRVSLPGGDVNVGDGS